MSFTGAQAKLCVLLAIDLPGHTIRLCEGGEIDYTGLEAFETGRYKSVDDTFGSVTGFEDYTSGQADEAPAFELTWAPKSTAAAVELSKPEFQNVAVRWRILSVNRDTNAVLSDRLIFAGIVDTTSLEIDRLIRRLPMGFTTEIDRFLNTNKGNKLSAAFHKSVWPGETGLDLMTGTTIQTAWGVNGGGRRYNSYGGGGANSNRRTQHQ